MALLCFIFVYLKKINELLQSIKNIFHDAALSSDIAGILHWDMSTMMPKNSRENRAEQLAYLSKVRHQLISSNKVGDLIPKLRMRV